MKILEELDEKELFIQQILDDYFYLYNLEQQEKAFINRVVYGTVEYRIKLDYIIDQFSKVKTTALKKPILHILRMSVYQLTMMDQVPARAIINEAVKLVKKRKMTNLTGFVNGVLRNIERNQTKLSYPKEDGKNPFFLSIMYSFPIWLIEYLLTQYPFEIVKKICEDSLKTPKISIRLNTLSATKEELLQALKEDQVKFEEGRFLPYAFRLNSTGSLHKLKAFQKGMFQVQDESSMLIGEIAHPKEDDKVLDVCAAPGGKITHMAQLMNNKGQIFGRDISDKKLEIIQQNIERLGISNIVLKKQDATEIETAFLNTMDIVLADVPCSGLGIIKKKPDIKYNVTKEGIENLIALQRKILNNASKYVKKGGILLYSTCTINLFENDENVKWFLENHPDFEQIDISLNREKMYLKDPLAPYLQLLPIEENSDGFFIAKLKRMT